MGLSGAERVLFVDAVYAAANVCTFLLRFVFFHYVLFARSPGKPVPATAEEVVALASPTMKTRSRCTETAGS